jgi:hypothetical protein
MVIILIVKLTIPLSDPPLHVTLVLQLDQLVLR